MKAELSQLPWEALQHETGGIPWSALRTFAEAVVDDVEVIERLFDVYTAAHEVALTETCYADLYVPAIFALAAPRLEGEHRRTICKFLATKLAEAGRDDDDMTMELLTAAAGTFGPAVLPAVLETIASEPDSRGAWVFLWSLTVLAAQSNDEMLRRRVIEACLELLEKADRGEAELSDGTNAAWTLGTLRCGEYTDLLQRLRDKARHGFLLGDYREAFELLKGRRDPGPPGELWEHPVEEWLTSHWKTSRQWFAERRTRNTATYVADAEEGLSSSDGLTRQFMNSPVAEAMPEALLGVAPRVVRRLVSYSRKNLDLEPEQWDEPALRELLLEVFPRQALGDERLYRAVVPVTEALLTWMGVEGQTTETSALAAAVHGWSDEIVSRSCDPQHWGSAKTVVMQTLERGEELSDSAARDTFVRELTGDILGIEEPLLEPEPTADEPGIPIVESKPRVGRNAPCPCGSGRKYKKCCGSSAGKGTAKT
ncbi:MAG: SEC-C metal-binding domain-containing protein [Planctomycetota bacterium]|jgi:hypothetical protein